MQREVRIGVVGLGIGQPNAVAVQANARGRVTALCDLDEERMAAFAATLPGTVRTYTDYHDICRDPEVDAVFVGTPNQLHVPVGLEAVKNDKHVLMTKPLADSEEAATTMVNAAESAGVVNMMSLSIRNSPEVIHLQRLASQGTFGELYYARSRSIRRSGIPAWNLGFIEAGGGAFRDMGVHLLDSAWWILGTPRPVTVTGVAGAKFGPRGQGYWDFKEPEKGIPEAFAADDYGGGFIRFEDGTGLQIESFWASHQKEEMQIELFGTEAGAKLSPLTLFRTDAGTAQNIEIEIPAPQPAWDTLANHFIACILDGVDCGAPLRHGLAVQEMMEALLRSAETGREVVM